MDLLQNKQCEKIPIHAAWELHKICLWKHHKTNTVLIIPLINITNKKTSSSLTTLPFKSRVYEVNSLSCVRLIVTPWTVAHHAPLSMEFSRQEYWSGLPFPSPGDLTDPGIEPRSPALQVDTLTSEPPHLFYSDCFSL